MAYTSLYRKYRPQGFDSMIGQQHIKQTLKNAILSQNIAHAYLFTGTRGTGKTSTAKIFAKAINCLNPKADGSPCNECEVCKALSNPNNLDIIELDAASNNSVEDIRNLIDKVNYAPSIGKYKVYIVDEVHMLSQQAFNAFLKTLEEPPEHVVFILATTEVYKIPATILSRCIRFDFRLLSKEDLSNHLAGIFNDMGIEYSKDALSVIADAGNGSVRDMLSIADVVISYCGNNKIEYNDVLEVLGASSPKTIVQIVSNIVCGKTTEALSLASKSLDLGKSVDVLCKDLTEMFRTLLYVYNCTNAQELLSIPSDLYGSLNELRSSLTNTKIYRAIDIFTSVQNSLKYTTSSRALLEMSIAKACDSATDISTDGLINRIKELEAFKRTTLGVNKIEGTTATAGEVWGTVLNVLKSNNLITIENLAAKVKNNELVLEKRTLTIILTNRVLYDELIKYKDSIYGLLKKNYSELEGFEIKYVIDEKKESINIVKNMFNN